MYFEQFIRLFVRATYLLFGEPATVDKKLVSCCKRKVVVFTTVEKPVPLVVRRSLSHRDGLLLLSPLDQTEHFGGGGLQHKKT